MALLDIPQKPIFQIRVAHLPGVVIAEDSLDVCRRKDLAHDVKYRIVIQGVSNLLELFEQLSQDLALSYSSRRS